MTNACRVQLPQRFPDALGSSRFTRMRRPWNGMLGSILEGWNMRIKGATCFVTCNIERRDTRSLEALHQFHGL